MKQVGYEPAFARDYDEVNSVLSYIDKPSMQFKQAKITGFRDSSGVLVLDIEDIKVSDTLKQALSLSAENVTHFKTFSRIQDVWVFADD